MTLRVGENSKKRMKKFFMWIKAMGQNAVREQIEKGFDGK